MIHHPLVQGRATFSELGPFVEFLNLPRAGPEVYGFTTHISVYNGLKTLGLCSEIIYIVINLLANTLPVRE